MKHITNDTDYPWFKFWPSGISRDIEVPDKGLHELVIEAAEKHPERIALDFAGKTLTYQELNDGIDEFARLLQHWGFKKGDVCCIFMPNLPQFVIAYYGALKAGGIVTASNPLNSASELHMQLSDSGSKILIAFENFHVVVNKAVEDTGVEHVVFAGIGEAIGGVKKLLYNWLKRGKANKPPGNPLYFYKALEQAAETFKPVEVKGEDIALIQYTGGTTGIPKGAVLIHSNLVANANQCNEWIKQLHGPSQETFVGALPLYHSYGMSTTMNACLMLSDKLILIPNPRDLVSVLSAISVHRADYLHAVPTMYIAINNYPQISKFNLRSLKACLSGAAPLPQPVADAFEMLTGANMVEGYGLSEASPVTHINPTDRDKKRPGTIGLPIVGTIAKVADPKTGEELPIGEPGELAIKGPQVMKEYWGKDEETKKVLRDGWLFTGDIATMDEDGFFKIVDRQKDMIIASGYKVFPNEVEGKFMEHEAVELACVIGIPDEYRGEAPKAFVKLKPGKSATPEELMEWIKDKLAKYKRPTQIVIRDDIPVTPIGKVLRKELRKEEMARLGHDI